VPPNSIDALSSALGLCVAVAIGLLIGVERGWRERELPEGGRVAGLRTFTLTGLLGGLLGGSFQEWGAWPLAAGILGVSLVLAVAYRESFKSTGNLSITSSVAMLLTLVLGAVAVRGEFALALSAAVIVAVLLSLKPTLHRWLHLIRYRELVAALQLLVLTVVILPNLPNVGYGPYQALNPFRLWWAVVLISALSLGGHVAMRLSSAQRGLYWTGVLGGLASSTATTLALARHVQREPAHAQAAAAGIVAACGVMFLRMATLVVTIVPNLAQPLVWPLLQNGVVLLLLSVWQWRRCAPTETTSSDVETMAPFDLSTALGFALFLAAMAVLIPAVNQWMGTTGIFGLAFLSGLGDVDATVISVSHLYGEAGITLATTGIAMGLTAFANLVAKAAIAWVTGGQALGWPVLRGYGVAVLLGLPALLWSLRT